MMENILDTPGFYVEPQNVSILTDCLDFKAKIENLAECCRKEVYISSLYIGTDQTTRECLKLIACNQSDLNINFLADYSRSLREDGHCWKIMDLFKENSPNKLNFHLFSANGSNIEKFPIKIREIYGVQHMKFLIFDDTIILTGANISKTYLMNRQDRYYVIKNSPNLKRFLISCYETITKFCYKIVEYEFTFNDKLPCNDNMSLFIVILASEINKMIQYYSQNCDLTFGQFNEQRHKLESNYAIIFPLIQFGKCNILNIDNFIKHIIKTLPNHQSSILITSAYINFDDNIEKTISRVASKECIFDLVLPNPKTNSFYQVIY
ncbi:MAG: CDP-diacylglycerol--glycerol-3-phosphate 3-phosphatidyltransferase [Marteilia pararefringens]